MAVAARISNRTPEDDKRMELTEHLGELRGRIIRCVLYIAVMGTLSYYIFHPMYAFLSAPMVRAMSTHNQEKIAAEIPRFMNEGGFSRSQAEFLIKELAPKQWSYVFRNFSDAFFIVLKMCFVAGIIFSLPLIVMEVYGFISPALTREEKRPLKFVVPFSVVLFAAGVSLAYWVSRFAVEWFTGYVGLFENSMLLQDPEPYVMFMLKMMGIFGLVFQLPVLLMFLAWVGILKSAAMKRSWRHVIVGISVVGLIITPSNDVFTMLVMIVPVMALYIASIWLVGIIERKRARERAAA